MTESSKVAIVGAGPAGLSAAKHLVEAGIDKVTIYEKSDEIGGVWRYTDSSEHPHATPVYESLHINLPAECMGFVDYPMRAKEGSFCSHREVFQYLKEYASKFGLIEKVKLSSKVEQVKFVDNKWRVMVNGEVNLFDFKKCFFFIKGRNLKLGTVVDCPFTANHTEVIKYCEKVI